jgi:hypothetical protein
LPSKLFNTPKLVIRVYTSSMIALLRLLVVILVVSGSITIISGQQYERVSITTVGPTLGTSVLIPVTGLVPGNSVVLLSTCFVGTATDGTNAYYGAQCLQNGGYLCSLTSNNPLVSSASVLTVTGIIAGPCTVTVLVYAGIVTNGIGPPIPAFQNAPASGFQLYSTLSNAVPNLAIFAVVRADPQMSSGPDLSLVLSAHNSAADLILMETCGTTDSLSFSTSTAGLYKVAVYLVPVAACIASLPSFITSPTTSLSATISVPTTVSSSLTVTGNLNISTAVTLLQGAVISVSGNLTLSSIVVVEGEFVSAGAVSISAGSQLNVVITVDPGGVSSVSIPVLRSSATIDGAFVLAPGNS